MVNTATPLPYTDARTACANEGGTLTSVLNQGEQDFLTGESNTGCPRKSRPRYMEGNPINSVLNIVIAFI